jgi:hypothetical protein
MPTIKFTSKSRRNFRFYAPLYQLSAVTVTVTVTHFGRSGITDIGAHEYGYALVAQDIANSINPNLSGVPFITAKSKVENTNNAIYKGFN